ncbi:MAG: hypothetical protein J0H01_36565 [Rhizobiales bacterium]|nr:hypothetical protein [Hyphomicrobiales bacterium]
MTQATSELAPGRTKLLVGLFVVVLGLVVLLPNVWPLWHYWRVDRSQAVTARWVSSVVTHSSRDTVSVPAYTFERRIGPMVQDCRIDLPQYRHAPDGKPIFETLSLVPGTTCDDVIVLDDPPRERIPLVLLGLALSAGGLFLTGLALRKG